ncbi:NADPH-dependent FMN reductase [Aporhodopirellula aestuarii]|uniref:NAD(P)H-dependent oxidoreductase n=1 Tax=Aporhodopirellula aestuarii TaxID=2950107 RepID=A0ABT0U478_9BACT|nr:NAD(P)H-dependent oxidoreductase [Aporhodopirellula aestuarii]MCM2371735.1 NAD(P)H-dependent oxidoreductase [Aporhodopirellula aestuarii]
MHLIISSSLHPTSRSRILAREVCARLESQGREVTVFDLSERVLPPCDGATAYGDSEVLTLSGLIREADSIFVASPVYNYDVNAAIKNAVELTGKAWTGKVVALMLAAGGQGSYMSAMGLANSLMLDFRCLIVPRFVYSTGENFEGDQLADEDIAERVDQLVNETLRIADALAM